jgi:hypothetical protein
VAAGRTGYPGSWAGEALEGGIRPLDAGGAHSAAFSGSRHGSPASGSARRAPRTSSSSASSLARTASRDPAFLLMPQDWAAAPLRRQHRPRMWITGIRRLLIHSLPSAVTRTSLQILGTAPLVPTSLIAPWWNVSFQASGCGLGTHLMHRGVVALDIESTVEQLVVRDSNSDSARQRLGHRLGGRVPCLMAGALGAPCLGHSVVASPNPSSLPRTRLSPSDASTAIRFLPRSRRLAAFAPRSSCRSPSLRRGGAASASVLAASPSRRG